MVPLYGNSIGVPFYAALHKYDHNVLGLSRKDLVLVIYNHIDSTFFLIGLYLYVCIFQIQNPELLFEVQELLEVAMNERQSKMEAKQVLAQLQSNYDELQKKFAAAEITIDKLRYVYTFYLLRICVLYAIRVLL